MAYACYVLEAAIDPFALGAGPNAIQRSRGLGCGGVSIGDSTGTATVYPSVVVVSTAVPPVAASVAIPDNAQQATAAQVLTAVQATEAVEAAAIAQVAAAQASMSSMPPQMAAYQVQIEADLASVANWATLPAVAQAEIMGRILQGFATMIGVLYSQALVTHSVQPPAGP